MTRDTTVTGMLSTTRRYGVALLSVAVSFALTQALWPWVAPHPTPLFLAAVMLSALYAGLGPSLVATTLAALVVDYFFIPPTAGIELSVDNAVRTGVFVAVALLISWIDAARRRAEAELRRHAMQQAAVAELGQRALWGISLSGLTDKAVSVLARRLDAGSAVFWEFSPEGNSLAARSSAGPAAAFTGQRAVPAESESVLSRALFSTEPVTADRVTQDAREARSCVSVAITQRGEPFGVLSVYADSPRCFTEEDVHFVQAVANVLSAAVERARGEEERSRLLRGEREARREAEEASRAKDEFLAMVSHELRTPLSVILGWSKLLREGGVNDETRARALEMIERNAGLRPDRMDEITTAALIFTAAGTLFVCLGVPLFLGRVRPNWWYGCRTEKTLSDEKVWYAVNRVTGRDIIAGGIALVASSLALLVFGRGMNPDHAVLALLFILLLSVAIMAVDSYRTQKRM